MKRDKLKDILQNNYTREDWRNVLTFLSGSKDLFKPRLEPKEIVLTSQKATRIVKHLLELGTITTSDGVTLPIFEIELQDNIKIEYNKVGVNQLIKEYILKDAGKGAIATYHYANDSKKEWRFSFISKFGGSDFFDEVEDIETNPKKYTYIFGTPEEHRTALERLYNLEQSRFKLDDFFEAFNVEPVSNNFFKEYKNFYLDFVDHLSSNEVSRKIFEKEKTDDIEKDIRNFVKRLLGRIVFLYFLQKKGWLGATNTKYEDGDPDFLSNLFDAEKEQFYTRWLTKLFFNALNTPDRPNDGFDLPQNYLEIRTQKELNFKIPSNNKLTVPFLNGGLFEEHQEPKEHRSLIIPAYLFEELFKFFNGYNFTIYENSPEDHTIAVDPEMLGNIFENLLEDNNDKGTFYTPKEIVHYMTQESLIEYLNTHLNHIDNAQVENLVKNQVLGTMSREDLKTIEGLLDKVKICDPAIGSGAFPMGLLQEIFSLKSFIHYELGYKVWNPAKIKQDIIQNSIYGVDIEEGAVDIARLRFWLSLVVDENIPKPLPNLDYKIMQGNSLLESYYDIDLSNVSSGSNVKIAEAQRDLFGNMKKNQLDITFDKIGIAESISKKTEKYFTASAADKPILKKEIDELVNEFITYNIELRENQLERWIKEQIAQENTLSEKRQQQLENWEIQLKSLKTKKENLLSASTSEKDYFLWHLFFKDVFDNGGFDIIIGNPPYVEHKKLKHISSALKDKYEVYSGTADLSLYFFELGFKLLKENGVFSFINTNKFFNTGYGKYLRKYLNKKELISLVNFEQVRVFVEALVSSVIILAKNKLPQNNQFLYTEFINEDSWKTDFYEKIQKRKKKYNQELFDEREWVFVPNSELEIKNTIELLGTPIKVIKSIEIKRGITTGYDPAFVINDKSKLQIENTSVIKNLLKGKEIKRFYNRPANEKLIFIPWHYPLHDQNISGASLEAEEKLKLEEPNLYAHLLSHSDGLNKRNKSETGIRYEWYALQRCAASYFPLFDENKIIWPLTADKWGFALDTEKHYLTSGGFFLVSKEISLKYILALLNSKLMNYYFKFIGVMTAGGAYTLKKATIEEFPIIEDVDSKLYDFIVSLIIFLHNPTTLQINETIKNTHIANFFEEIIDGCVFELYFKDHMVDKGINIIDLVQIELDKIFENIDSDNLEVESKKQEIWELYKSLKNNQVQQRLRLFVTKSPDILKPILQN